jgi:hypothetical protein
MGNSRAIWSRKLNGDREHTVPQLGNGSGFGGHVLSVATSCTIADNPTAFVEEFGFEEVKADDWSDNVSPFWGEVLSSALTFEGLKGLSGAGWGTVKGALVVPLMQRGYEMGAIKFVIIAGTKPGAPVDVNAAAEA